MIGHHFGFPYCLSGWIGVEMFFVLSGFLITTLLYREFQQSGDLKIINFWARRVFRLLPIYWLYAAFITIVLLVFKSGDFTPVNGWTRAWWLGGIWAYYINLAPPHIWAHQLWASHLWSLAIEEQFYLCWPAICLIAFSTKRPWAVPTTLTLLVVAARSLSPDNTAFTHYLTTLPCSILAGCTIGLLYSQFRQSAIVSRLTSSLAANIAAVVCVALLIVLVVKTQIAGDDATRPWAVRWFVPLYMWPFAMLVGAFWYGAVPRISQLLAIKPLAYIGKISYGMYLYHMLLLCGFKSGTLWLEQQHGIHLRFTVVALTYLATLVCIASLSYRFIEVPFLRIGSRFRAKPKSTVTTGSPEPVLKMPVQRFHQLDGLRALAASLVVVHHVCTASLATSLAAKGHTYLSNAIASTTASGVELFFVLSGVLLLRPYLRGSRAMEPMRYLYGRVRRLWPPYLAAWLLAGASVYLIAAFPTWWTRGASLPTFSFSSWVAQLGIVYTGQSAFSFAWWSLSVEVLFYLLVPVIVGLLVVFKPNRLAMLGTVLAAIVAAVLMTSAFEGSLSGPLWPVHRFITYASCFAAGIAMARFDFSNRFGWLAIALGAPYCIIAFAHPQINPHVGWGLLYTGVVTLALNGDARIAHWLSRRPAVWLGERSYSLFLVHYAVITAVCQIVSLMTAEKGWKYFVITRAIELPLMLLVTMVVFHFIERHFARNLVTADRFWPQSIRRRRIKSIGRASMLKEEVLVA